MIPIENWVGFKTGEKYCKDWKDPTINIHKRVRAFYKGRCVECGMEKEENGKYLDVNHVNDNKDACCSGEPWEWLFVLLCQNHHRIATLPKNREHYKQRYKELIAIEYGGKCYYTLEEFDILIKEGKLRSEDWGRQDGR